MEINEGVDGEVMLECCWQIKGGVQRSDGAVGEDLCCVSWLCWVRGSNDYCSSLEPSAREVEHIDWRGVLECYECIKEGVQRVWSEGWRREAVLVDMSRIGY